VVEMLDPKICPNREDHIFSVLFSLCKLVCLQTQVLQYFCLFTRPLFFLLQLVSTMGSERGLSKTQNTIKDHKTYKTIFLGSILFLFCRLFNLSLAMLPSG